MKVAASPRSRAQVSVVLAFVISHTTFLAAQDDEAGRCPKVACDWGLSRIVILSVSENSLPFAVRWSMFGNIKRETCSP